MNRESYKSKRKGQRKRSSKIIGSKRHVATVGREMPGYNQPHLREAYLAKSEWVKNVIPKLKD